MFRHPSCNGRCGDRVLGQEIVSLFATGLCDGGYHEKEIDDGAESMHYGKFQRQNSQWVVLSVVAVS